MQQLSEFLVTQKITPMVNRYLVATPEGGTVLAFAEQKRLALKERVTLWSGEDRTEEICTYRARNVMDLGPTCDVTGRDGEAIGSFRKDVTSSLLRSTWQLAPEDGLPAVGTERSGGIAIARRIWKVADVVLPFTVPLPFVFHFDFVRQDRPVLSVERLWGVRDRYRVQIHDPALDRRLALALSVALDAFQSR
ncbi:hypothetical protein [Streptomyces sp. NPDC059076]|uniref:hypothetical protein n=1 Tax=unclassified Streptomyces TaxID=2593676 RepID=UPI00367C2135